MHVYGASRATGRPHGGWSGLRPGTGRRAIATATAVTLGGLLAAALLAACGGSSGGPASPAAPASSAAALSPTPAPSPQITRGPPPTGAVAVVKAYWTLLAGRQYDAAEALTTARIGNGGDQPGTIQPPTRFLRASRKVWSKVPDGATVEFASWIYIVPMPATSPFGTQPRRWYMYSSLVRMSDGSWRLVALGTGP